MINEYLKNKEVSNVSLPLRPTLLLLYSFVASSLDEEFGGCDSTSYLDIVDAGNSKDGKGVMIVSIPP